MTFLLLGTQEIIIIALIVIILFGGKKIPELMRGLGRGVRSFKEGMNGVDDKQADKKEYPTEDKTPANDR